MQAGCLIITKMKSISVFIRKAIVLFVVFAFAFNISAGKGRLTPPGYPERSDISDLEGKFMSPPQGYGEVPFYWWIGDTLTREHLEWELDQLAGRKISSLQVNYCHQDHGGLIYGLTYPSQPALFSEEWWELFGWFMDEAGKRGMTVSLSDYTLGPGQGSYVDSMLADNPDINGYELKFDSLTVRKGENFDLRFEGAPVSVNSYMISDGRPSLQAVSDMLGNVADGRLTGVASSDMFITSVTSVRKVPSINPMHPDAGKSYVDHFFGMFERRFPGMAQKGLNFFFSDELNLALNGNIWDDNFRKEFRKRKGYDILPYHIDALYLDMEGVSPKVRMDYNDVRVSLSEENFFKPLFDWHQERGLLFGCDHGGRGKDVSEFGDYFRTQRWNQAPGCDQPNLERDIVKNKVASSIAHLYNRERVWLEGFHSSGWGTNSSQLTDAIFSNFVMGHNLLSLHGLYYTTKGGRWEWAPPCNHFHEPYWADMDKLLECTERLSYLLSQGYHVADVAVLYPVEPVVAGFGDNSVRTAFDAGERLYRAGIDFDFMDYESLHRATIRQKSLNVAGESYKVVVVPAMEAMKHASLQKLLDFANAGGVVVNIGATPSYTDEKWGNTGDAEKLSGKLFGIRRDNVIRISDGKEIVKAVESVIDRDFKVLGGGVESGVPYVMHRRMDSRDLYAVYNAGKGTVCRFRASGGAELWNPYTGERQPLAVLWTDGVHTDVALPLEKTEMHLIMFNPDVKVSMQHESVPAKTKEVSLDGEWDFTIEPQLDNTYGDFIWPGTPEKLGLYLFGAKYRQLDSDRRANSEPEMKTFGFGTKFLVSSGDGPFRPYDFSWRWGVEGDYGHQGWHGLKGEMYDDFIRLGRLEREFNGTVRRDDGSAPYTLQTLVDAPYEGVYDVEWGNLKPAYFEVNGVEAEPSGTLVLAEGKNRIVLRYDGSGATRFVIRGEHGGQVPDFDAERPLTMKYRGDLSVLPFDTRLSDDTYAEFSFTTPPGLESLEFTAHAAPEVTINGTACTVTQTAVRGDGAADFLVTLPSCAMRESYARMVLPEKWGYAGGAVIDAPVKMNCTGGIYHTGDWCDNEVLRTYSGSACYSKDVYLSVDDLKGTVTLDLGEVVSSANVRVNGVDAGSRLAAPWNFNIGALLRPGKNTIEVRVSNTAANLFLSSPTVYRGNTRCGLFGPVRMIIQSRHQVAD